MLWIRIKITEYPEKELHGASYLILASHSEHLTVFMAEKAEPAWSEHRQSFQKNADLFFCSSSFETVLLLDVRRQPWSRELRKAWD